MSTERIRFQGTNNAELSARLDLPPSGRAEAFALFAHCFTCSKDLKAAVHLSRALTQAGVGVLRFDFTGLGESEGDFADTTFSSNVGDLVAAARHMEAQAMPPAILVGHSLGGAAVLCAAAEMPAVRAVVTIGAPGEVAHVRHLLQDAEEEIRARGEARVVLAGRAFTIRKEFLDDLDAANLERHIANLRRALLVLHAPTDNIVGIDNAARIYTAAKHPKSFVSLHEADHLLTEERHARYAGDVIAAWVRPYLDPPETPTLEQLVEQGQVLARIGQGLLTELQVRHHASLADEPAAVGGNDLGPTPYDLLVQALGACTAMTLRLYADRKGWPLEEVLIRLEHRKIHGMDAPADAGGRIDAVDRVIHLSGPLDAAQRTRLLDIANRCPVHRTLESGVHIETRSAGPDPNG